MTERHRVIIPPPMGTVGRQISRSTLPRAHQLALPTPEAVVYRRRWALSADKSAGLLLLEHISWLYPHQKRWCTVSRAGHQAYLNYVSSSLNSDHQLSAPILALPSPVVVCCQHRCQLNVLLFDSRAHRVGFYRIHDGRLLRLLIDQLPWRDTMSVSRITRE